MHTIQIEKYITEMIEIEDWLYELIESQWTTVEELSMKLTQQKLYLNDMHLSGIQATEIVKDICFGYYRKIWLHYREPNFTDRLDEIEKYYPLHERTGHQIAVVKDPHNKGQWRIRKMLFKRLRDRENLPEPEPYIEPTNLIRSLSQYSDGILFYGEDVQDPKKIWIDPGATELFLSLLHQAKATETCVHEIIEQTYPEYLKCNWFIIPEKREYFPHFWVGTLKEKDE